MSTCPCHPDSRPPRRADRPEVGQWHADELHVTMAQSRRTPGLWSGPPKRRGERDDRGVEAVSFQLSAVSYQQDGWPDCFGGEITESKPQGQKTWATRLLVGNLSDESQACHIAESALFGLLCGSV